MYAKRLPQNLYHEKTYGKLLEFGYKDFYNSLTGEGFDADAWGDLVVKSGARYAGVVTEHSDNFSMWDSKISLVNCVNYGPRRDITVLTAKAFWERGIKVLTTFHHAWNWGWFMSTDNEADVYDPTNEKYYGKALPLETNRYLPYAIPIRLLTTCGRIRYWRFAKNTGRISYISTAVPLSSGNPTAMRWPSVITSFARRGF
jgi:alpha-L-fucosidase